MTQSEKLNVEDIRLATELRMVHKNLMSEANKKVPCLNTMPCVDINKELGLDLHPITATDANSAAYPSGHTMDFLVILYHFGKMNPKLAEQIDEFYHEIKRARELSGLHYPSDRKVSEYLFKQLVKHNLIK